MANVNEDFFHKMENFMSTDFCAESINSLQSLKIGSKTDIKCQMELFVMFLQQKIVSTLQSYESETSFRIDRWLKDETGGGISCVLQDGKNFTVF